MESARFFIFFIFIIQSTDIDGYYYYTDKIHPANNNLSLHCMIFVDYKNYIIDGRRSGFRQNIEYCIELSSTEVEDNLETSISSKFTFQQLKDAHVNVQHLIEWSASMDQIERYQSYLQMNTCLSTDIFYNCTKPWFGSFCQYKLPLNVEFHHLVVLAFNSKRFHSTHDASTCYVHIKCDRGHELICLDWREICDGKIDCIDGGEDERHCHELSGNQCADNEYQCRNGMCIDRKFLLDSETDFEISYECIDRSDEVNVPVEQRGNLCVESPYVQCEDATCPFPHEFSCGDGDCIKWPTPKLSTKCLSGRDRLFSSFFQWNKHDEIRFPYCYKIATCSSDLLNISAFEMHCKNICGNREQCKVHLNKCPSYYFVPDFPVFDGHVRLGYFINKTLTMSDYGMPHFVCFDKQKCSFLKPTFDLDHHTCMILDKYNVSDNNLYSVFIPCIHLREHTNQLPCTHSSMIACVGTNKCVSRRHVADGIPDCYNAFDESVESNSCSLNDTERFQCLSENKCLLPTTVTNSKQECIGKEDELLMESAFTDMRKLPFFAFCDGIRHAAPLANETDETSCEHWSCINQYTRCNKRWNCPKGIDELGCSRRFNCSADHHLCVFPINRTVGCIHLNHVDDGIVDCLGSTDERTSCRQEYPDDKLKRYRCWNNSLCVNYQIACKTCPNNTEVQEICLNGAVQHPGLQEFMEGTNDIDLIAWYTFFLDTSRPYPVNQAILSNARAEWTQSPPRINELRDFDTLNARQAWLCNRGIFIYRGRNESEQCLCPPSYYGDRCQYQNQRITLTLLFRLDYLHKTNVLDIVITLVDNTAHIHSHEQLTYIPVNDCNVKFHIYLLYQDRPKDMTKNYTVHIDAYSKISLSYFTGWRLPVQFLFMPVNRMSAELILPTDDYCRTICNTNGRQGNRNINIGLCPCELNIIQITPFNRTKCNCAPGSTCASIVNNRSICICPLTKYSPRCFIDSACSNDSCMNGGICVPMHGAIPFRNFTCVCQSGFHGKRCEDSDVKIEISFVDIRIPQSLLVHFITVRRFTFIDISTKTVQAIMFKKIGFHEDVVTFFMTSPFEMVFSQIKDEFYLTVLQHIFVASINISTQITPAQHCPHIRNLFNQSILDYPTFRRVKYYHLICTANPKLSCFQDSEMFMCLCTEERHANCFHFDFNMTHNCMGSKTCLNEAECFQDNPTCPTKMICVCRECYYGPQCQYTTRQFGLALDAILGYKIRPHISILKQSIHVKISIAAASIMLFIGLISGVLSILTFQSKGCQKVGCGMYLLMSSITSLLTIVVFNLKLWFLILSQMSAISSHEFLQITCISTEFLLRILLVITDWFHACVSAERFSAVVLDVKFSMARSKRVAKSIIYSMFIFVPLSFLHDPIHRRLIYDEEDQRTWCLIDLPTWMTAYNSFINSFHFLGSFSLKLVASIGIIVAIAKQRVSINRDRNYRQQIKEQLKKHRHMVISSICMVILALPRLIFSFSFGCMKSAREPSLFLVGYFVSFIPSLLTFMVFVLTSETYGQEFKLVIKRIQTMTQRLFKRY